MERNTVTILSKLQIGDRFYKTADPKRKVYTKVEGEVVKTYFQTYKHYGKADNERFPVMMKGNTSVIFLRSK